MVRIPQHRADRRLVDLRELLVEVERLCRVEQWRVRVQECLGEGSAEIERLGENAPALVDAQTLASLYEHIYQTIDGEFVGLAGGRQICRLVAVDSSFWEIEGRPELESALLAKYGSYEQEGERRSGDLNDIALRVVDAFPEPEISQLKREVFADFEPSALLAEVLAAESASRPGDSPPPQSPFRVAAYRGDALVGWSYGYREGAHQFCMLNSGVVAAERRKGVYTQLVEAVLSHAKERGYVSITSRHVPTNAAVLIAKLRLGFQVSGYEYSEVYGPLVRLTYLVGEPRRQLYKSRAAPIRSPD